MSSNDDTNDVCASHENKYVLTADHDNEIDLQQYPLGELLDRAKAMRSEIGILEKLVADKYDELRQVEQQEAEESGGEREPIGWSSDPHVCKLRDVLRAIFELEDFTNSDGLNDDVVDEYVRHLERNYEQVLIFGPDDVQTLSDTAKEMLPQLLQAKRVNGFEKVLFVLKKDGHYSLVLFNRANASFYHYDAANKRHAELAEQIILKLRHHFDAEQLVEVESSGSLFGESSLFTVDSMMKIILTAEDESKENVSPVHVLNIPSQPDYLKIIIMSRYIVTKLCHIENVIRGTAEATSDFCIASPSQDVMRASAALPLP